jgi:hypothetical protein
LLETSRRHSALKYQEVVFSDAVNLSRSHFKDRLAESNDAVEVTTIILYLIIIIIIIKTTILYQAVIPTMKNRSI